MTIAVRQSPAGVVGFEVILGACTSLLSMAATGSATAGRGVANRIGHGLDHDAVRRHLDCGRKG
jgi:hypothetical protein